MKILLIDDDKAAMRFYVRELGENGFEVEHCRSPDTALIALNDRGEVFRLIILDSAMPPGKAYASEETDAGTSTGAFLLKDIRKKLPKIPIIVLTNFLGLDWMRDERETAQLRTVRKIDVLPTQLVTMVREMIKSTARKLHT